MTVPVSRPHTTASPIRNFIVTLQQTACRRRACHLRMASVTSAARLVSLSGLHVRLDVRMASRFPPREPCVSASLASTDVDDEVRDPQGDEEYERDHDGSRSLHGLAPSSATD